MYYTPPKNTFKFRQDTYNIFFFYIFFFSKNDYLKITEKKVHSYKNQFLKSKRLNINFLRSYEIRTLLYELHQSVQKLISYGDSQKKTVLYEILYGINLLYYSYIEFRVSHFAHLHEIKTYISVGGYDISSRKFAYIQTFY